MIKHYGKESLCCIVETGNFLKQQQKNRYFTVFEINNKVFFFNFSQTLVTFWKNIVTSEIILAHRIYNLMMENNKKNTGKSKLNFALQNTGAGDCVAVQLKNQCGLIIAKNGCNTR